MVRGGTQQGASSDPLDPARETVALRDATDRLRGQSQVLPCLGQDTLFGGGADLTFGHVLTILASGFPPSTGFSLDSPDVSTGAI